MQDLNDKVAGNTLTAPEWNEVPSEIQNLITDTGQSLSSGDLDQLGKAVRTYVADSDWYLESGAANAYVLTSQTGRQPCPTYTVGMRIRFIPTYSNTAASVVNVDAIGSRALVDEDGNAFVGDSNEIRAGKIYEFAYNGTAFQLVSPVLPFDSAASATVPVGATIMWHTSAAPSGFLECDGSSLATASYPSLFAILGYTYGGSGANFNIPDLRGEFPRGWSHSSGNDPDAASRTDRGDGTTGDAIGTKQADEFESHTHDIQTGDYDGGSGHCDRSPDTGYTASTLAAGGSETRPRNVNVMWCIRAQ
jgi:microcystin-dependent protein